MATGLSLLLTSVSSLAQTCDDIKSQIDSKMRTRGLSAFVLDVVDADQVGSARIVGNCGLGKKRIVYLSSGSDAPKPASSSPARPDRAGHNMITECKDGTVGGNCGVTR